MHIIHADGSSPIDLAGLNDRARRAASGLAALGVGAGDTVALLLRNDTTFFEAAHAAGQLGAYVVCINWHFRSEEIAYVLKDCAAKVLIAHADLYRAVAPAVPPDLTVLVSPTPGIIQRGYELPPDTTALNGNEMGWVNWLSDFDPWEGPAVPSPGSMVYTSGTTGRPKGVRRKINSPAVAEQMRRDQVKRYGLVPGLRTVITGPMYHGSVFVHALGAARLGSLVVLQPRFEAEELLKVIEQYKISNLNMVPTMFVRLLHLPKSVRDRYDVSSVKYIGHTAAPCPIDIKRSMIEWFGPVLNEFYSTTEVPGLTYCTSEEWLAHPGTVGKPEPGTGVCILGENGANLQQGDVGEVFFRPDHLSNFTYHNDDAKRRNLERNGLVSVGDIGFLDNDGFLYLCDRKGDMIISGGVNIYPAEIESVLINMPGVKDCAVFGVPDREMGESVAAAIETRGNKTLTPAGVQAWLRDRIAGYKVPRHIEFHPQLPRHDTGKIFKAELRNPHWQSAGRSI